MHRWNLYSNANRSCPQPKRKSPDSAASFHVHPFTCLCGPQHSDRTMKCLSDCVWKPPPVWLRTGTTNIIPMTVCSRIVKPHHSGNLTSTFCYHLQNWEQKIKKCKLSHIEHSRSWAHPFKEPPSLGSEVICSDFKTLLSHLLLSNKWFATWFCGTLISSRNAHNPMVHSRTT